jgi:hypothetical protein
MKKIAAAARVLWANRKAEVALVVSLATLIEQIVAAVK